MALKLEGGGHKALMAWQLVEELFFAATLIKGQKHPVISPPPSLVRRVHMRQISQEKS